MVYGTDTTHVWSSDELSVILPSYIEDRILGRLEQ